MESLFVLTAKQLQDMIKMCQEKVITDDRFEDQWELKHEPEHILQHFKRIARLQELSYNKMVRDMKDLKWLNFTEETFESWWNRTHIEDTHKAYVRNKLIKDKLLLEGCNISIPK